MNEQSNPKSAPTGQRSTGQQADTHSQGPHAKTGDNKQTGNQGSSGQSNHSGKSGGGPGADMNKQSTGKIDANQSAGDERQNQRGMGAGGDSTKASNQGQNKMTGAHDPNNSGSDFDRDNEDSESTGNPGQKKVDPAKAPQADASGKGGKSSTSGGQSDTNRDDRGQAKHGSTTR